MDAPEAPVEVRFDYRAGNEDLETFSRFYDIAQHLGREVLIKIMSQAEGHKIGIDETEAQRFREDHRDLLLAWYEIIEPVRQIDRTVVGFDEATWFSVTSDLEYAKLAAEIEATKVAADNTITPEVLEFNPDTRATLTLGQREEVREKEQKMRRIKHAVVAGHMATASSFSLIRAEAPKRDDTAA